MIIEVGELKFAEPAFRQKARIVAILERNETRFALQYQHEGEPGHWLPDPSFPWHGANLSTLVIASARFHEKILKLCREAGKPRDKKEVSG